MNFYKITNEKEEHYGVKYKDGLNVDVLPWNPSGDCEEGGIYFSREDILCFLNFDSAWVRKVEIPEGEETYENPGEPKKWKAHKVFLHPRRRIDVLVIKELIGEGADPKAFFSSALRWAAVEGYTKIVKLLIPHSDPKACDSEALRMAAEQGHKEIVELLIPHSDPKVLNSSALGWAAWWGHKEVVELLMPHSDPNRVEALKSEGFI